MPPEPLPAPPHLTHVVPKRGREKRVELFWSPNAICTEAHAQASAPPWGGGGGDAGGAWSLSPHETGGGEARPPRPRRPGHSCCEVRLWETLGGRDGGEKGYQDYRDLNLGF